MAAKNFKDVIAQYFKPGANVEISSDDDGFRGSWFEGRIVQKLKKDKILVEYNNLLEEDGKRRLTEEVNVLLLRPLPPRESPHRPFNLSEDVDAYFNDGWWEGTITKVLSDERYLVYFRVTREQMEFQRSDLRLHREWLNGMWDPPLEMEPEHQKMSTALKVKPCEEIAPELFCPGARVEVSSDEDGFAGAWFAATVIEQLGKDNYLIEYESLRNDEDTEFLREDVDSLHIRPYPPNPAVVDCFKVFEEVDALYNDGWWVGVISEVLGNQNYSVYFRGTDEEMEFKHSDLRKHQDWIDGKWIIPSQDLKL